MTAPPRCDLAARLGMTFTFVRAGEVVVDADHHHGYLLAPIAVSGLPWSRTLYPDVVIRRDDILGAWRLVSYTAESATGEVSQPLGDDPVGIIVYTADGFMSAQLMRRDRPAYDKAIPGGGSPEQMAAAASGYLCYSGPYTVDEAASTLHHHVDVSLIPNWLGGTQIRSAEFDGETLTLSAQITPRKGPSSAHVLVWRRAG